MRYSVALGFSFMLGDVRLTPNLPTVHGMQTGLESAISTSRYHYTLQSLRSSLLRRLPPRRRGM